MALVPFEAVRFRTAAAAALLVERGSLEGYRAGAAGGGGRTADGRERRRRFLAGDAEDAETKYSYRDRVFRDRVFRDRANRTPKAPIAGPAPDDPAIRSPSRRTRGRAWGVSAAHGPESRRDAARRRGRRVGRAALPHSAVARLVRTHPSTYARIATRIARRLRPSLPARAWDRCGARWIRSARGRPSPTASRRRRGGGPRTTRRASPSGASAARRTHTWTARAWPNRTPRTPTACTWWSPGACAWLPRMNALSAASRGTSTTRSRRAPRTGPPASAVAPVPRPGRRRRRGAILRDAAGAGFGAGFGEAARGGKAPTRWRAGRRARSPPSGGRAPGPPQAPPGVGAHGARAPSASPQLLWIPAASLESLATSAPRAFAALARRMGARARRAARCARRAALSHPVGVGVEPRTTSRASPSPVRRRRGSASVPFPCLGRFNSATPRRTHRARWRWCPSRKAPRWRWTSFARRRWRRCAPRRGRGRVADSAARLEVGQAGVGALANEATAHWLAQLEAAHDVVLLKADPFPSPWCAQCARHADAILLVASSEDTPPTKEEGARCRRVCSAGTLPTEAWRSASWCCCTPARSSRPRARARGWRRSPCTGTTTWRARRRTAWRPRTRRGWRARCGGARWVWCWRAAARAGSRTWAC